MRKIISKLSSKLHGFGVRTQRWRRVPENTWMQLAGSNLRVSSKTPWNEEHFDETDAEINLNYSAICYMRLVNIRPRQPRNLTAQAAAQLAAGRTAGRARSGLGCAPAEAMIENSQSFI